MILILIFAMCEKIEEECEGTRQVLPLKLVSFINTKILIEIIKEFLKSEKLWGRYFNFFNNWHNRLLPFLQKEH